MNSKFFLTIALVLSATLAVQAQDDDDLYFTPTKKSQKTSAARVTQKVYSDNGRDDDEYNRRYTGYAGAWQTGGEADSIVADSMAADMEYAQSSGSAYDLTDPENDYVYSRRILRFHSPRFGFAISSPYYWDLVYGWGVYDYLYDPYYDYFYDPFYWSWGWGYGWAYRPWNTWYGPIWGWHHSPHGWHDWGCGPMWHDHGPVARFTGRGFGAGRLAENRFATSTVSRAVNSANGSRNTVSVTTTITRTVNTRNNNGRTGTFTSRATVQDRTGATERNEAVNARAANRVSRNVQNTTSRNNTNAQNNRTTTVNNNRTTTVNTRNNTTVNTRNNAATRNTNSNATRTVTTPTRSTSTVTNTRSFGGGGGSFSGGRSGGGTGRR